MKIAEVVLEELHAGRNLSEIRTKYRSVSQVYEGVRTFLDESERLVSERQAALRKTAEQLVEEQAEVENARAEKQQFSREVGGQRLEKDQLGSEVMRMRKERDSLKDEIKSMRSRGYTPGLLKKIRSVEPRSGAELWADVQTVSRCRQLAKKAETVKQEIIGLEADIKALKATKREDENLVRSEENKLDDLKLRVGVFKGAASTIELFLRDGYSVQDLKSLKAGLDMVGIKGEPRVSVTRLVEGLRQQKSLIGLEGKVDGKREELRLLNEASARVKKEAEITESAVLKAVEEVRDASAGAIAATAEKGAAAADACASRFEKRTDDVLSQITTYIQDMLGGLKAELGTWGELGQESARLDQLLIPARVLFGIVEDPEYVSTLPLPLVVQLFTRLQGWCEANLNGFRIQPSANISARAFNLPTLQSYNLAVLTALVCEGLNQYMIQKNRQLRDNPGPHDLGSR